MTPRDPYTQREDERAREDAEARKVEERERLDRLREHMPPAVQHAVSVGRVGLEPRSPLTTLGMGYFQAACSCGWQGPLQDRRAAAQADAMGHQTTAHLAERTVRP